MHQRLTRFRVAGYRSLRDVTLEPGAVTVLIGPNGSGKSNLLSALRLLPRLPTQSLQYYVRSQGGASHLLHQGPKVTPELAFELQFGPHVSYAATLAFGGDDALFFGAERATSDGVEADLGSGHRESVLRSPPDPNMRLTGRTLSGYLAAISAFHFHDTSLGSALRINGRANDTREIRSDGANLTAHLLELRRSHDLAAMASWRRINELVRQAAPFIKELTPVVVDPSVHPSYLDNPDVDLSSASVRLDWIDQRDNVFGPDQLSDGTLRFIALVTALAQPARRLPPFLSIDEPELGLHPAALSVLAGLIRSVSSRAQVVLATQSPALLDHFAPEEVVVCELVDGETHLRRLDPARLKDWLEEYTLAQLYDKNLLGGRP